MMRPLLPLALCVLLPACATNPFTGRSQLMLIDPETEASMGVEAFQQVTAQEPILSDADVNAPLLRVGRAVTAVADQWRAEKGLEPFQWEFRVIADDETVNAWCLPGGKIAFYTGIYPVLQDENGMAIVMGHEISHAMLRHGAERVSQNILVSVGMTGAAILAEDSEYRDEALAALGLGVTVGIMLPYSRDHETEADKLGLELAARAGYDPQAAIGVWERMSALGGGDRPPEFLSTHPAPDTRIANMQAWMPEAQQLYAASRRQPNQRLPEARGRPRPRPAGAQQ